MKENQVILNPMSSQFPDRGLSIILFSCMFVFSWASFRYLLLLSLSSMSCLFLSSLNCTHYLIVVMIVLLSSVFVNSFRQFILYISIILVDLRGDVLSSSFILFVFFWDLGMSTYFTVLYLMWESSQPWVRSIKSLYKERHEGWR